MAILLSELVALAALVAQCSGLINHKFTLPDDINEYINTTSGRLKGLLFESDPWFQSWTNIHYAVLLRYKPPQSFHNNDKIVIADSPTHRPCLQYKFLEHNSQRFIGTEEGCLTLSVYRYVGVYTSHVELFRKTNKEVSLLGNVIVLLRPGTFMYDYPFDGRKFAASMCCDFVITVVVNYRLGALGKSITPNIGLLDQISALTWVQRNIAAFYGDPDKVTLVGVGAGAAAVQLHMLSKRSAGLFSKAASFGGSALVPWAIARNGVTNTKIYFDIMGCGHIPQSNKKMNCLRKKDPANAGDELRSLYAWMNMPLSPLGPAIDYDLIEDEPIILLRGGNFRPMPWLVSFTDGAGTIPGARIIGTNTGLYGMDNNWSELAPWILELMITMSERLHYHFSHETIKKYYKYPWGNEYGPPVVPRGAQNKAVEIIKMLTDRLYTTGIVEAARLQGDPLSSDVGVYLYRFSYIGELTFSQYIFGHSLSFNLKDIHKYKDLDLSKIGPPVGDDFLVYIANQYNLTTIADKNLQTYMSRILLSFCAYGTPSIPITWVSERKHNISRSRNEAPEMKHINYIASGRFHEQRQLFRLRSKTVTYNHIKGSDQYEVKHSNDLGESRYWDKAPFIYPQAGTQFKPVSYVHYFKYNDTDPILVETDAYKGNITKKFCTGVPGHFFDQCS